MRPVLLTVILLGLGAAVPARAQMMTREGIMLQNQILELRRDLDAVMQRGVPAAPYPSAPPRGGDLGGTGLEAQLLDRVQTLEQQVRELRGELDERTNQLQRAQEELAKQVGDLAFKLGSGGPAGTTPSPTQPPGQPGLLASPGPTPTPVQRPPELALQEGNAALGRRDYAAAEAAAREVLARGKTTPRAGDAQFLLAQALLGERNFQAAAVAYDDAYNANRRGSRAEDSLLGLANALTGMGEKPAACATLEKLRREFPETRASVRDAASTLRGRNGCS